MPQEYQTTRGAAVLWHEAADQVKYFIKELISQKTVGLYSLKKPKHLPQDSTIKCCQKQVGSVFQFAIFPRQIARLMYFHDY